MKNILTLFCILSFGLASLTAQVSEHSLAFGFYNYPSVLEKLANERWVIVGYGTPTPGGTSVDTIFAVIFDQKGEILHRKRLALPNAEIHQVEDVVAMPDGGFVISVGLQLCDAGFNEFAIQRYDSTGQLIWSRSPDNIENLCSRLALCADGNLMGTDRYYYVYKFDVDNGTTLWKYPMHVPWLNFFFIGDFEVIPGTDNIISVGSPDFQYWEQSVVSGDKKYILYNALPVPPYTSPKKIFGNASGYYYTFIDSTLYRFNQFSEYQELNKYPFPIQDAALSNQSIFLLYQQAGAERLVTTDLLGTVISDVPLSSSSMLSAHLLGTHDGTFVVAGVNGSGPDSGIAPWLQFNATNTWFRTFTNPAEPPAEMDDVALAEIVQEEPLAVSEITLSWPPGIRYNIAGGDFSVLIANHGQTVLDKVDVLVGFEWNDTWICYERPAIRKRFTQLALLPGESKLLDFGDIYAGFQPAVPTEICFWTSAPNERPDNNPDDDIYCHKVIVNADEPQIHSHLRIFPNPANDFLKVEHSDLFGSGDWQLSNSVGQVVASGSLSKGEQVLELEIRSFPDGFYFLTIGNWTAKLVIAH